MLSQSVSPKVAALYLVMAGMFVSPVVMQSLGMKNQVLDRLLTWGGTVSYVISLLGAMAIIASSVDLVKAIRTNQVPRKPLIILLAVECFVTAIAGSALYYLVMH